MTVLVGSQVSDRCPWATCLFQSDKNLVAKATLSFDRLKTGKVEIGIFLWSNRRNLNSIFAEMFIE